MEEPNLLLVCLNAFAAVMVLLTLLTLAMRALITVFPEKKPASEDKALVTALNMALDKASPGARVTRIEELR